MLTILAMTMIITGCGKEVDPSEEMELPEIEYTSDIPDTPSSMELDIDEDGNIDFVVEYFLSFIFSPTSTMGIFCRIEPIGSNLVLHKEDEQNLFLRDLSDIKIEVNSPLFWNDHGWSENIMSILNNNDEEWPNLWNIHCEDDHESYFLGLKLIADNPSQVGWIEIKINRENGAIMIVDKGLL